MSLKHFGAKHFSKLRHFYSAHFAGVEVEIVVTPGGGYSQYFPPIPWEPAKPYVITIRIKRKGETWETTKEVSQLTGKSLEKILITFKGVRVLWDRINIEVGFLSKSVKNFFVNIIHKK